MEARRRGRPIQFFTQRCAGCLMCALRCSLRFEEAFNPSKARIRVLRLVDADTEYAVAFDTDCDNCGICARHCPYEALIQEQGKGA
jgi:ferredoxin